MVDIFKDNNNNGKGYSNLSFEKVLKHLGLSVRFFGTNIVSPPQSIVDDELVKYIASALRAAAFSLGSTTSGNESARSEFISPFMTYCVMGLNNKDVLLKKEHFIKGSDISGPVEYVVIYKDKILDIVEAKKDDLDQGRAQLLMEIHTAYQNNIHKHQQSSLHKIYGAVSTGNLWEFVSYCKDSGWAYHGQYNSLPLDPTAPLEDFIKCCKQLVQIITGMMEDAINEVLSDVE